MNLKTKGDILKENNFLYWINFLHSRTNGNVKLVVVGTHADELYYFEMNSILNDLKNKISEITKKFSFDFNVERDFYAVGSNAVVYTRQLSDLKHYLVNRIPSIRDNILNLNDLHLKVLEKIKEISKNNRNGVFVLFEKLQKELSDQLKQTETLKSILFDLSSLGTIIYFEEDNLSQYIINDIEWLNKVFLEIVKLKEGKDSLIHWNICLTCKSSS